MIIGISSSHDNIVVWSITFYGMHNMYNVSGTLLSASAVIMTAICRRTQCLSALSLRPCTIGFDVAAVGNLKINRLFSEYGVLAKSLMLYMYVVYTRIH